MFDQGYSGIVIVTRHSDNLDATIISIRETRAGSSEEYAEYEIVKEPEVLPPPQRLLPP